MPSRGSGAVADELRSRLACRQNQFRVCSRRRGGLALALKKPCSRLASGAREQGAGASRICVLGNAGHFVRYLQGIVASPCRRPGRAAFHARAEVHWREGRADQLDRPRRFHVRRHNPDRIVKASRRTTRPTRYSSRSLGGGFSRLGRRGDQGPCGGCCFRAILRRDAHAVHQSGVLHRRETPQTSGRCASRSCRPDVHHVRRSRCRGGRPSALPARRHHAERIW